MNGPVTWAAVGSLAERVTRLEERLAATGRQREKRGNRAWLIVTALLTGLIFPVAVTILITVVHLHSTG
jgi:hypothetical protein